ncbi:Uncharacterised protein [Serratia quinivorans]|nr:Uncharacterised protein [Serratia quinivorans]CAI1030806.1 Uncharacterised protein [Serratia quinivorans]CAI1045767.1 Uncharacterised protein [Serratia quinivorans]CAI1849927.1 Uncharacterised protein [Serratia quinivorans]CAI2116748.1 Uncharacterised protein [Serratia quinivorans]
MYLYRYQPSIYYHRFILFFLGEYIISCITILLKPVLIGSLALHIFNALTAI